MAPTATLHPSIDREWPSQPPRHPSACHVLGGHPCIASASGCSACLTHTHLVAPCSIPSGLQGPSSKHSELANIVNISSNPWLLAAIPCPSPFSRNRDIHLDGERQGMGKRIHTADTHPFPQLSPARTMMTSCGPSATQQTPRRGSARRPPPRPRPTRSTSCCSRASYPAPPESSTPASSPTTPASLRSATRLLVCVHDRFLCPSCAVRHPSLV